MSLGASSLFTQRQLSGLCRVGDLMMPANGKFPTFSQTGCIERIDDLMGTAHPDDIRDLGLLLLVFNYLPKFSLHWILQLIDKTEQMPGFIAPLFRTLNIGIKGVVFSLYYSGYSRVTYQGPTGLDAMDYQVHCAPDQK